MILREIDGLRRVRASFEADVNVAGKGVDRRTFRLVEEIGVAPGVKLRQRIGNMHDPLQVSRFQFRGRSGQFLRLLWKANVRGSNVGNAGTVIEDRKSTRLNSSH